jgi:cytochrome c553
MKKLFLYLLLIASPVFAQTDSELERYIDQMQRFIAQTEQSGKVVNYREPVGGSELQSLLDPARRQVVLDEYVESLKKREKSIQLFLDLSLLHGKLAAEFEHNSTGYEVERLDALSWLVCFIGKMHRSGFNVYQQQQELIQLAYRNTLKLSDTGQDRFIKLGSSLITSLEINDQRHVPSAPVIYAELKTKSEKLAYGQNVYRRNCAACHQSNGMAVGPIKGLVGSVALQKSDALIEILLRGQNNGAMPSWKLLSDQELAAVANYVREIFGKVNTMSIRPSDIGDRR